jgi:hypothetical protein
MLVGPAGIPAAPAPVSATGDVTTTSSTAVLITGMTLTPAAGTYLVRFVAAAYMSTSAGPYVELSIWVGGVQVPESTLWMSGGHSLGIPLCVSAIVTVNGSQAIEARWKVVGGSYTAGMHNTRTLSLIQVG